jgi:hypothetical protein
MHPTVEVVSGIGRGWVPDACSLPTAEQPLRLAEFDDLFARSVLAVDRQGPTTLHLDLDPVSADRARGLAAREVDCCSFFGFDLVRQSDGAVSMTITVPPSRTDILDALTDRVQDATDHGDRSR